MRRAQALSASDRWLFPDPHDISPNGVPFSSADKVWNIAVQKEGEETDCACKLNAEFPKDTNTDQNLFVLALDECLSSGLDSFVTAIKQIWTAAREQPLFLILLSTSSQISNHAPEPMRTL